MDLNREIQWFSFKGACVSVLERGPPSQLHNKGNSRVLFFIHGRFGHAYMWEPLISLFSNRFRCIAVNLPGFGYSYLARTEPFTVLEHANLIKELVIRFTGGEEKVVFIGHDLGGALAQYCSLQCPEKVDSFVFINTLGLHSNLEKLNSSFGGLSIRWKLHRLFLESAGIAPVFVKSLKDLWRDRGFRSSLIRSFDAVRATWPRFYEQQMWKKIFSQCQWPVLLLWGKKDSLNSMETATDLVQRFSEAYYFLNEDAGHWPNLEKPEWVFSKMKEFFFKTEKGSMRAQKAL